MKRLSETYKLSITPLTPIHVGSGEEINPGEYFILKDGDVPTLYAVDLGYMASKLSKGSETILKRLEEDPVGWVEKTAKHETFAKLVRKYSRFQCEVTQHVGANVEERWGKKDSRLGIRTLQRPFKDAILPGSSIKGAIRTALLYTAVQKHRVNTSDRSMDVAGWERRLLGGRSNKTEDAPLRHLGIGDAVKPGLKTIIYDADFYGMKTESGDQAELQAYYECFPEPPRKEDEYCLETTLSISSGYPAYSHNGRKISVRNILESCRAFYGAVLDTDLDYWKSHKDNEMVELYQKLKERISQDSSTAITRLGWGSGMDSVSLNLAKPSISGRVGPNDTTYRRNPTTRRLLDSLPAGWAEIKLEKC